MRKKNLHLVMLLSCVFLPTFSEAWEHHPLISDAVLKNMPEVTSHQAAPAVPLEAFLLAVESELEIVLAQQEDWACTTLPTYAPRPRHLAFVATGNPDDIRHRFFRAIRINPSTRTPLYISQLADHSAAAPTGLAPEEISLFPDSAGLKRFHFIPCTPGDLIRPLDIVASASNEPDFGMDVGLFEDNGTPFGVEYGFGKQPFGDPGLDYGSQAPFHMGFYHESWLVFLFAGFLKETYPEYRIHQFKTLSELAFREGQDYWGWRFMGWGLHYMTDLSMPYHTTVLPGVSTLRMLFINFLDILGFPRMVDNALQLVSNRHMAIERYQRIVFERAWRNEDTQHPMMAALLAPAEIPPYTDELPRKSAAKDSNDLSRKMNRIIRRYMPERFVMDPDIELVNQEDLDQIVEMVETAHGAEALDRINAITAEALASFVPHGRSYVMAILAGT